MAASLYSVSNATSVADLKAALNAKSLITTVYYEDTTWLIISSPLLTGKVLKFQCPYSNYWNAWFGDAWTSGSTITNPIQIWSSDNSRTRNANYVIADTNWCVVVTEYTTAQYATLLYFGVTDAGKQIIISMGCHDNGANKAMNMSAGGAGQGRQIRPITMFAMHSFKSPSGNIYTWPFWIYDVPTKMAMMNSTALDSVVGLKTTSYKGAVVKSGTGYKLYPYTMYNQDGLYPHMSVLIEYTP